MRTRLSLLAGALFTFTVLGIASSAAAAPTTDRASVSSANAQANNDSGASAISKNGRIVAFESAATILIGNDANVAVDVFVRNRRSGTTSRVSVGSGGTEANDHSYHPQISDSGRFVAFTSDASNLIELDENTTSDVFVHDRKTKRTTRISTRSNGAEATSSSHLQGISADGRYVLFYSSSTDLVRGDTNGSFDVFVKDRRTGKTALVSKRTNGAQANDHALLSAISPNGRYVAFLSGATNLVANDSNGLPDVFVHDRKSRNTVRASVASNGAQSNNVNHFPAMSDNGIVAFPSFASNLVNGDANVNWDVFVHNIKSKKTRRVSLSNAGAEGNGPSGFHGPPKISADGMRIAFDSQATNLVAGDSNGAIDAFLHDRDNRTTRRVSVRFDGSQGDDHAFTGDLASGGGFISFRSSSTNLVAGDTNSLRDVFVRGFFD